MLTTKTGITLLRKLWPNFGVLVFVHCHFRFYNFFFECILIHMLWAWSVFVVIWIFNIQKEVKAYWAFLALFQFDIFVREFIKFWTKKSLSRVLTDVEIMDVVKFKVSCFNWNTDFQWHFELSLLSSFLWEHI